MYVYMGVELLLVVDRMSPPLKNCSKNAGKYACESFFGGGEIIMVIYVWGESDVQNNRKKWMGRDT